jgi:hypothetical protein
VHDQIKPRVALLRTVKIANHHTRGANAMSTNLAFPGKVVQRVQLARADVHQIAVPVSNKVSIKLD